MLNTLRALSEQVHDPVSIEQYSDAGMLPEEAFLRMLSLERKRTERSRRGFILMFLEPSKLLSTGRWGAENLEGVLCALTVSSRETDVKGWFKRGSVIGVIFTEIDLADATSVANSLRAKVRQALARTLPANQINEIRLSFQKFPESSEEARAGSSTDATAYPELSIAGDSKRASRIVKKVHGRLDVTP